MRLRAASEEGQKADGSHEEQESCEEHEQQQLEEITGWRLTVEQLQHELEQQDVAQRAELAELDARAAALAAEQARVAAALVDAQAKEIALRAQLR